KRHLLWLSFCALATASAARGADILLEIELPSTQILLPPVSPPHLQREGMSLISEERIIAELMPLIGAGDYEAVLPFLREGRESLLGRLEAGDPEGLVRARVGPGGATYGAGTGLVSAALLFLTGHVYFSLERYLPAETAFMAALV